MQAPKHDFKVYSISNPISLRPKIRVAPDAKTRRRIMKRTPRAVPIIDAADLEPPKADFILFKF